MKPKPSLRIVWKEFYNILVLIILYIDVSFCRPTTGNVNSVPRNVFQNYIISSILSNNLSTDIKPLDLNQRNMDKRRARYDVNGEVLQPNSIERFLEQKSYIHSHLYNIENKSIHDEKLSKNASRSSRISVLNNDLSVLLEKSNFSPSDVDAVVISRDDRYDDVKKPFSKVSLPSDEFHGDVKHDVIVDEKGNNKIVDSWVSDRETSLRMPSEVATFIHEYSHRLKRNRSRKRRQTSAPDAEQRLRKRRRKPKHRHHKLLLKARDNERNHFSDSSDSPANRNRGHRDRFILRSDDPGYLITSASEVKRDWCRTLPLQQTITQENCEPLVVTNHFCYGQCNSFFIPYYGGKGNAFQSCAFCKPHRSKWGNVTLNCPGMNPPKIEKKILIVESCRCKTEVLQ